MGRRRRNGRMGPRGTIRLLFRAGGRSPPSQETVAQLASAHFLGRACVVQWSQTHDADSTFGAGRNAQNRGRSRWPRAAGCARAAQPWARPISTRLSSDRGSIRVCSHAIVWTPKRKQTMMHRICDAFAHV